MIERIVGPLPDWAYRENPILSYHLRGGEPGRVTRMLRGFGITGLLALLLAGGYAYATDIFNAPAGQNLTEAANRVLFFPLVILQLFMGIMALAYTVGTVGEEQRRVTWDNLRATPNGAGLTLRTRWISVFYRLRLLLFVVTIARLLLIFGVLRDLTAFQGRYLDLLVGGVTPNFPVTLGGIPFAVPVAALMLSLFLTAALLLPFTMVAFDAAIGLWFSTRFHNRAFTVVLQFLLVVLRVAAIGGLVWLTLGFADGSFSLEIGAPDWLPVQWLVLFGMSAFADLGTKFLHLGFAGEMWVIVPYSIFIGPLLLVFTLLQAFLADVILKRAVAV
ncbi:MAG: hypothetical protein AAF125_19345, partial [Chloroflexota bacterium]